MNSKIVLGLLGATALAGCNLAPKYVRPIGAVPAALPQGGIYPVAATDAPDITKIGWRDFFTDDRLRNTIALGLENNRDLRIAAANVLQARAQYRIQRADLLPTATLSGSATYTNNVQGAAGALGGAAGGGTGAGTGSGPGTGTGGTGTGGIGGGTGSGTGSGVGAGAGAGIGSSSSDLEFYSVNAGFSAFELDLFGRVRNLSRAALEQYFATEEAQRSTRISLIAEIATAWLTYASDQDQLRISQDSLKSFAQSLELTRAQFRIGIASELEARQAETTYQAARNDIAVLKTRVAQDKNALDLLVGTPVSVALLPQGLGNDDAALRGLPANLASDVLLQRPDVLQAEHQLIAQNANIGAARAAMFPTISLTATLGTISTALSGLFSGGSFTYTGAPSVSLPLFDGGRRRGNLDVARAQQQAAVSSYERAVQTAFREVADALAQRGTIDEQISAQTARVNAATVALRISDARYRAGVESFLNTLDSQRTAYAAQQQLVTTRLNRESNLVELYRSLGGGLASDDPVERVDPRPLR
ncbi:efflux transporter outer membrane subunit [Sphingomonas endolithica]|uniref:efflux transporter outer membrane subunit n=1 Tax=Sphingomonas endolithica TaxID=2972485 RepID=UPI0021AF4D6E|nr:efflux transporter outer membrane subunit [Sphingomonas sp. ZFBP2030]